MNNEAEDTGTTADLPEEVPAFQEMAALEDAPQPLEFEDIPVFEESMAEMTGLEAVHEVPVRMQAILGRARMTVAELMKMRPGRVVELDRKVGEPVDIFVNNRLIARGEVVMIDNALGVTLTEIVRDEH